MRKMALLTFVFTLLAGFATAQEVVQPKSIKEAPVVTNTKSSDVVSPDLARRNVELRQAKNDEIAIRMAEEKTAVAVLVTELDAAVTSQDKQDIQRQIQATKETAWRDILAIQLKYARLGGFDEQALSLEERIVRLDEGLSKPQAPVSGSLRNTQGSNKGGE